MATRQLQTTVRAMRSDPRGASRRAVRALAVLAAVALGAGTALVAAGPAAAATDTVAVDFSTSTGAVAGKAAGALYGLSQDGVPTDALVSGASLKSMTTNAPNGAQHPSADPLKVAAQFFRTGGTDIYVNIQDFYPDFPYNGGVRPNPYSSYLTIITNAVTAIKNADPSHFTNYVFVPFNEPDLGNWYRDYSTAGKNQFLADWSSAYSTIKAVDSRARIGGPGLAGYNSTRVSDLLSYAKAQGQLPDVFTWHELSRGSLAAYRGHYSNYRSIESSLGITALPVNITEWGNVSDMSVPGQLVQWISMLEDTKVAGNTPYWNYSGNLNDNSSGTNGANGGWWLLKWYGDLTGNTVKVTPPQLNVAQTVQGTAAVDATRKQGTVLLGGGANDIAVQLNGLSQSVFGSTVDIRVAKVGWSGYEGDQQSPRVIKVQRADLTAGTPTVTIPNTDRMAAYQLIVTPSYGTGPVVDAPWSTSVEAESTTLANVNSYSQDTDANAQLFATSGKADVGNLSSAGSSMTWNVTVPTTGTYRYSVFSGANKAPGRNALFVDGAFNQIVQYTADEGWLYRNKTDVTVSLSAGTHALSLRTSQDGSTTLPGSNVAVDKFELTQVTGAEQSYYPARYARTIGTPTYVHGIGINGALLQVSPASTAQFFVSARDNGYYDIATTYRTPNGAANLALSVNGRSVPAMTSPGAGSYVATARVHVPAGISELRVGSTGVAQLGGVTLTRVASADSSTKVIEAESGTRAGAVTSSSIAASVGSNVSGNVVGNLGNGSANTLTIARPSGTAAGAYDLGVKYANAEQNTASHYNTDVITRYLTVSETGGSSVTAPFRNDWSWSSFWWKNVPLTLSTSGGSLVLGNSSGWAPDVDQLTLSPFVLSTSVVAQ